MLRFSSRAMVHLKSFALTCLVAVMIAACSSPEERAQSHYEKGMQQLEAKKYQLAAIEFKSALQLQEEHPGALRGLARIEEERNNWEAVAAILRKLVTLDPKDLDSRLRLVRLLVLHNALDDAGQLLDAAGEANARNSGVLALRGVVQVKLNNLDEAYRLAETAVSEDPGNIEALMVRAAVRLSRNDAEGALKLLNAAPAKDADQIGVQLFKLKLYEKIGDQEKVEGVLLRLAAVYPAEREFRRQLVRYYVQRRDPERAEAEVRRIAKDNPTDVEASLDVIRFLNATKGKAAARAEIDTRVAAGGEVFPYQLMAVDLDLSSGDIANARRALEKLIDGVQGENALQARAKLAEILVSGREFSVADQVIAEILRKDERNTGGLKLRGVSRTERGDYTGAIADFRQALYDQPRATDIMLLLALAYERSGQIELADRQFAEALRTSNADAGVGLNYASFLQRRGNTDRAEQLLSELAARQPQNAVLWSRVGQLRLARQDWSGAQEAADTLRKLGTDVGVADQLLAASLSGQKQFDASVGVLQNAYSASPDSPRAMYALVSALMRAQKADRAVAFLAKVLDKDPSNADALVLMASVALAGNRPEEAKERLQKAIEVKPRDSMAYRALADLHLRQGKPEESIKVLQTGLGALPTDSALRLALAGALERKGDITAAITEYETLARAQPGSMIVSNNLASLLSDHATDPASLERAYALALSLRKSEVPQFKDTLGWVHYRRGEYKEALSLLEDAAQLLPNLALVRYHLAMTYKAAGDSTKAAAELNKALELSGSEDGLKEKIKLAIQQNSKT